jgi:hypothetical protein
MFMFTNRLWVRHDQPESEGVNSTLLVDSFLSNTTGHLVCVWRLVPRALLLQTFRGPGATGYVLMLEGKQKW